MSSIKCCFYEIIVFISGNTIIHIFFEFTPNESQLTFETRAFSNDRYIEQLYTSTREAITDLKMPCRSIRWNVLPRHILELFPFFFLLFIIPVTYWFEIWVVLPGLYSYDVNPIRYLILFIIGHFLLMNVVGNLLGVMVNDTSIRGRMMPSSESPAAAGYCDECKTVTPARSYHCPTCKICILRRDHHCLFTACCIGHHNYRYFLMFLLHMFLSVFLCIPYNLSFLWEDFTANNFLIISQIMFPFLLVLTGFNFNPSQLYLIIWVISIFGMIFIGAWFYFHFKLALSGRVVHELRHNINLYDLGTMNNLADSLGKRWYLVWLTPFLQSELLTDGITYRDKTHIN